MTYRIFAVSALALGLLAPSAFAQSVSNSGGRDSSSNSNSTDLYGCSTPSIRNADYIECQSMGMRRAGNSDQFGFSADRGVMGPQGDFVGETAQQSNQRSSESDDATQ